MSKLKEKWREYYDTLPEEWSEQQKAEATDDYINEWYYGQGDYLYEQEKDRRLCDD